MINSFEKIHLRELAQRYADVALSDEQKRIRTLWRMHNSLKETEIPIYIRAIPFHEDPDFPMLKCEDPVLRQFEYWLVEMLYRSQVGDDYAFDPFFTVNASHILPNNDIWGMPVQYSHKADGGSYVWDAPLKELDDIEKLAVPRHEIDEIETAKRYEIISEIADDILPVTIDRRPAWFNWHGDIATDIAKLRGLEQIMWDMIDEPEWLHRLLKFMSDGIVKSHDEAEAAGDWRLASGYNQAMTYAEELPDPSADSYPASRNDLWCFMPAQEYTLVSPKMHDEFMLQYQMPIMEKFGLVSYGCCEDLSDKIDILRKIPNLRRIAVAPAANVAKCAEQIGRDYVVSYRPNPSQTVCCGFDADKVYNKLITDLTACKETICDITLKDVETVEYHPERIKQFVEIARKAARKVQGS